MIKTIVFDIGNVVWQYRPLQTKLFRQWAQLMGITLHQFRLNYFENNHLYRNFETNSLKLVDWFSDIAPSVNPQKFIRLLDEIYKDQATFSQYKNQRVIKLISTIRSKGITVGCLSNTENYFYPYFKKHFVPLFDFSITSWEAGSRKPDPKIYHEIFKHGKFLPSEVLFIDDVPSNVLGAKKHGLNAVLFTGTRSLAASLSKYKIL